jgi:hypothetical protein
MLLAGDTGQTGSQTVQVRRLENPFDDPSGWEESSVPPTGPGNALVGWSEDGELAYCGTGQLPGDDLDESAFSASGDGDKWRQMGLMDTEIALADLAVTPDGDAMLITTSSDVGPEGIWRTAGSTLGNNWERVLTLDTSSNAVILRMSQEYEDDDTIYAAEVGGDMIAVTHTRGNSWKWCRGDPGTIVDLAVVDEDTVYVVVEGGYFRKSTNGVNFWKAAVETELDEINMMTVVDADTILLGGTNGEVAYSTDGGDTFVKIPATVGDGTGDVQVIADLDFAENGLIYAATDTADTGIWRWVIGESDVWDQIDEDLTDMGNGQVIGSLVFGPEGTLYALRTEPAGDTTGGFTRTLNAATDDPNDVEFNLVNRELEDIGTAFDPAAVFGSTLPFLKLCTCDDYNEIWTIDTVNQAIYYFRDTLCKDGPEVTSPDPDETLSVDASGNILRLTLGWDELSDTIEYEAVIYGPSGLDEPVWAENTEWLSRNVTVNDVELYSGYTYYWRVRATEPVLSPWSELQTLNPGLGSGEWNPFTGGVSEAPANGVTGVSTQPGFAWNAADWATGYELVLATDAAFSDIVISKTGDNALTATVYQGETELDYATTYFWKVRAVSQTSASEWAMAVFTTQEYDAPMTAPPTAAVETPNPTVTSTPYYVWILIGIGVVLVGALLWLIVKTRQV